MLKYFWVWIFLLVAISGLVIGFEGKAKDFPLYGVLEVALYLVEIFVKS